MIFCFSAMGNTLFAAKKVSEACGERLVLISGTGEERGVYTIDNGENIGIFFPVHGWQPPKNVLRFIENTTFKFSKQPFCYTLCTAGDTVGEAVDILKSALRQKNITLHSGYSLIMPESYVGLPFMDVDNQEKEKQKIESSKTLLNEYIPQILSKEKGVMLVHRGKHPKINSRVIGGFFHKKLVTDKPFSVEKQRCTKCGACARLCPTNDIEGEKGTFPTWKHNGYCLSCFKCYHHCPTHAIEYGKRTKKKGQYYFKEH